MKSKKNLPIKNALPRIGIGYDIHQFALKRKFVLGGVNIPFEKGLLGHSDADVLLHAICDALLGALALGDIGTHFPNSDPRFKNISSIKLLKKVHSLIDSHGYFIGNIDAVIITELPKLAPYIKKMQETIAQAIKIQQNFVSIKATTNEQLGALGRLEGCAAFATVLIYPKNTEEL